MAKQTKTHVNMGGRVSPVTKPTKSERRARRKNSRSRNSITEHPVQRSGGADLSFRLENVENGFLLSMTQESSSGFKHKKRIASADDVNNVKKLVKLFK